MRPFAKQFRLKAGLQTASTMSTPLPTGRHFLQIPGPANVPDRVLRAMAQPLIDHRGPEFSELTRSILERLQIVFSTSGPVIVYPASGHGAWEAALTNTLSPGDKVLAFENGQFATKWSQVAENLRLSVDLVSGDWRRGVDNAVLAEKLASDRNHEIKAVIAVHTETSTGVTNAIGDIRSTMDRTGHPALLMVDAVSSLATTEYRHDEWAVDVTVSASQKGLLLPPGLSFNAISEKALRASEQAKLTNSYWNWKPILSFNERGFFPYTPATSLLFGLDASLGMLLEEGLENVSARHARLAEATRRAVHAWGLEVQCSESQCHANSVTGVRMPLDHDADTLRKTVLDRFNMSLGKGLGKVEGRLFRIGHLGDFNELMLAATLSGVEMGFGLTGVPHQTGGVQAALEFLVASC
jgi:alanine-glyoxylate transaminase/serine-glyoxylate transaminase/serine-pyruvate transaminase